MTAVRVTTTSTTDGWSCHVVVEATTPTEHTVRVRREDLVRYAPGAADPTDLVRRSLAFLLAREPNTSILRSFDLPVIARYFPEYEVEIRRDA